MSMNAEIFRSYETIKKAKIAVSYQKRRADAYQRPSDTERQNNLISSNN